jgi:hypothetical protein
MAADKTLVDAFSRYGQAMGMANASLHSNAMMNMLTQMGNKWIKEKEEDVKKNQSYMDAFDKIQQQFVGVNHLHTNPENYQRFQEAVYKQIELADQARESGDKQAYGQVMQTLNTMKQELASLDNLYQMGKTSLSPASRKAGYNKIFNKDGQYEMFWGEDGKSSIQTATEQGFLDSQSRDLSWYADGLVPDQDKQILDIVSATENKLLQISKQSEIYDFDDPIIQREVNQALNQLTENEVVLMNLLHGNSFNLTDDDGSITGIEGSNYTIGDEVYKNRKNINDGAALSKDFLYHYNNETTVPDPNDPTKQINIYDKDALTVETKEILKKIMKENYEKKVKPFTEETSAVLMGGGQISRDTYNNDVMPDINALNDPKQKDVAEHFSWNDLLWKRENGIHYYDSGERTPATKDSPSKIIWTKTNRKNIAAMLKVLSSRHNYNYDMDIPSGDPKIPVVDTTTTTDSNDSKITILEEGEEGVIKKGWIGSNKVKKVDGKWKVWAGKTMGGWKDATQAELNKINKKYK